LGEILIEEDLIDLARYRKLGLNLADPSLRRGQLEPLISAEPLDVATIDFSWLSQL
jgi:hypothetical protein